MNGEDDDRGPYEKPRFSFVLFSSRWISAVRNWWKRRQARKRIERDWKCNS